MIFLPHVAEMCAEGPGFARDLDGVFVLLKRLRSLIATITPQIIGVSSLEAVPSLEMT